MSINLARSPRKTDFWQEQTPANLGPGVYSTQPTLNDQNREKYIRAQLTLVVWHHSTLSRKGRSMKLRTKSPVTHNPSVYTKIRSWHLRVSNCEHDFAAREQTQQLLRDQCK